MKYIFGPVNSRRFGLSLGIDLSPAKKSCNFDCIYCELGAAKPVNTITYPPVVEDVIDEVKKALNKFQTIDVITITANGEPTLYPELNELVEHLTKIKGDKKLLILSNASTINQKEVQDTLCNIDIVKLSLDCATKRCFKRIDRPLKTIDLGNIIAGMQEFRKNYKGLFVVEILVVEGINDKEEEFEKLSDILQTIKPDRVDIGTIDRPPAYNVKPIGFKKLFTLSQHIKNIPTVVVSRDKNGLFNEDFTKEEILSLLAHRPITTEDIQRLFSKKSQQRFTDLKKSGQITSTFVGNVEFFTHHAS